MKLAPAPCGDWMYLITQVHTGCLTLSGQQCFLCKPILSVRLSVMSPHDASWEGPHHWSSLAEDTCDASILDTDFSLFRQQTPSINLEQQTAQKQLRFLERPWVLHAALIPIPSCSGTWAGGDRPMMMMMAPVTTQSMRLGGGKVAELCGCPTELLTEHAVWGWPWDGQLGQAKRVSEPCASACSCPETPCQEKQA